MAEPVLLVAYMLAAALCGTLLGLIPGFHTNTLALLGLGTVPALLAAEPGFGIVEACALLVAFAGAGAMGSLLPSAILGAYDDRQALSALPAQRLFLEGRAHEAVTLGIAGAVAGFAVGLALVGLAAGLLAPPSRLAEDLRIALPILLTALTLALILGEKGVVPYERVLSPTLFGVVGGRDAFPPQADGTYAEVAGRVVAIRGTSFRLRTRARTIDVEDEIGWLERLDVGDCVRVRGRWRRVAGPYSRLLGLAAALLIFLAGGLVGLALPLLHVASPVGLPSSPLFPVLAGMFGLPALVLAAGAGRPTRSQQLVEASVPNTQLLRDASTGAVAGVVVGVLPGVTPAAAAAVLGGGESDPERSILRYSAAESANAIAALAALFLLGSTRSGEAAAVARLVTELRWRSSWPGWEVATILFGSAVAVTVGGAIVLGLSRHFVTSLSRLPTSRIASLGLALTILFVFLFTGPVGLGLYALSGALGMVPVVLCVRRTNLLGVLLVPVLFFLWGIAGPTG